jgi:hypothetical protein
MLAPIVNDRAHKCVNFEHISRTSSAGLHMVRLDVAAELIDIRA